MKLQISPEVSFLLAPVKKDNFLLRLWRQSKEEVEEQKREIERRKQRQEERAQTLRARFSRD